MTAHTPGPWTRKFGSDIYAGASPTETGRLLFVAQPTNGFTEELEEAWANARLAAAAPVMLEALELAEATLERLAPGGSRATAGTRDVLRAAIAKSKGVTMLQVLTFMTKDKAYQLADQLNSEGDPGTSYRPEERGPDRYVVGVWDTGTPGEDSPFLVGYL